MFKVNIVSAITMIAVQSITNIHQAVTKGDPAEHNLSYSQQINSDNPVKVEALSVAFLVYYCATLARIVCLFLCIIKRDAYKLLLPIS